MLRFPVKLDPQNPDDGIKQILSTLKPEWVQDRIKRKSFSEGFMNTLFCCHLESDPGLQDAFIFRILINVEDPKRVLAATMQEVVFNAQVAAAAGCGTPVLALFQNGTVSKCAPGTPPLRANMRQEQFIKLITRRLAQLHSIDPDKLDIRDASGKLLTVPHNVRLFEDFRYIASFLPEKGQEDELYPKDEWFSKQHLQSEAAYAESFFKELNMPVVFSHNDFHSKNMVYDKLTDDIMMIDFDISGYNYACFDLGALLEDKEYAVYLGFCGPDDVGDMTDDELRTWIKYYLEYKAEINGKDPKSVCDLDREILFVECKFGSAFFHLMTTYWCIANYNNPAYLAIPNFSIIDVANIARKNYERSKEKWSQYKHQLVNLRQTIS